MCSIVPRSTVTKRRASMTSILTWTMIGTLNIRWSYSYRPVSSGMDKTHSYLLPFSFMLWASQPFERGIILDLWGRGSKVRWLDYGDVLMKQLSEGKKTLPQGKLKFSFLRRGKSYAYPFNLHTIFTKWPNDLKVTCKFRSGLRPRGIVQSP